MLFRSYFDLDLEWTPAQFPPAGPTPAGTQGAPPDGPDLLTALQEQLGLRLEAQRGPAEVLVIDSATRPEPD